MHIRTCRTREEYVESATYRADSERVRLEAYLAEQHNILPAYAIPGFCKVCDQPAKFLVDRQWGGRVENGIWVPNWRERLVCPGCQLNNRQRAMVWFGGQHMREGQSRPTVFMTEQMTAFYRAFRHAFLEVELIGSEYLGPGLPGGAVRNGIRHEDVENLSLESATVDLLISNEVLEHVNDPDRALREMLRVLRPGGRLILTTPFDPGLEHNRQRASVRDGLISHLHPPVYHGNPLTAEGSLVFTDFGWELLRQFRTAGFAEVEIVTYWSYEYGHLGRGLSFFSARC